jgi:hypothetical protein
LGNKGEGIGEKGRGGLGQIVWKDGPIVDYWLAMDFLPTLVTYRFSRPREIPSSMEEQEEMIGQKKNIGRGRKCGFGLEGKKVSSVEK